MENNKKQNQKPIKPHENERKALDFVDIRCCQAYNVHYKT